MSDSILPPDSLFSARLLFETDEERYLRDVEESIVNETPLPDIRTYQKPVIHDASLPVSIVIRNESRNGAKAKFIKGFFTTSTSNKAILRRIIQEDRYEFQRDSGVVRLVNPFTLDPGKTETLEHNIPLFIEDTLTAIHCLFFYSNEVGCLYDTYYILTLKTLLYYPVLSKERKSKMNPSQVRRELTDNIQLSYAIDGKSYQHTYSYSYDESKIIMSYLFR